MRLRMKPSIPVELLLKFRIVSKSHAMAAPRKGSNWRCASLHPTMDWRQPLAERVFALSAQRERGESDRMGAAINRLLIANRGEIAVRIARSAAELGIATVSIHSRTTPQSLHTRRTDETCALPGAGVAPYLDGAQIIAAARASNCQAGASRLRLPQRDAVSPATARKPG